MWLYLFRSCTTGIRIKCNGIEVDRIQEFVIHRAIQHSTCGSKRKVSYRLCPKTVKDVQAVTTKNHQQIRHPSGIFSYLATLKILILVSKKIVPQNSHILLKYFHVGFPQNSYICCFLAMFPLWLVKPWYSSGMAPSNSPLGILGRAAEHSRPPASVGAKRPDAMASWENHGKSPWNWWSLNSLWWTNIAMENGHRNSGFSH